MYTITLADGQKLTGLDKNGDNFVSKTKVDESIFVDNLDTVKISDGETETVLKDVEFIQQMEWMDGTWYLAFRETPSEEKSLTDMELAIAEVYEMILGGE